MDAISAPVDWLGLNYYTRKRIAPAPGPWPGLAELDGPLPKTDMGWEIYPDGLGHFLGWVRDYTGDTPLYVTENGMASAAEPDTDRIAYLDAHLGQARAAIARGVPLKGYFVWSMLDNYEWAFGYAKRFGLVAVDFPGLQRRPRASYHALARMLAG